jgi:hypothetical protein
VNTEIGGYGFTVGVVWTLTESGVQKLAVVEFVLGVEAAVA